ncbi:hypothetical protein BT96DRAFT_937959 [Gymnopus androsaceus JB14]|uniref:Uncharacterized protein n=1 Tax=Gymnopus androsaceus JB14 TaxID=1447944 RepID=A0A6A4HSP1_9AGAR|nr:hypothetical protein BT96DRAFT_937959 [Gymnopus androsaceus JB14]
MTVGHETPTVLQHEVIAIHQDQCAMRAPHQLDPPHITTVLPLTAQLKLSKTYSTNEKDEDSMIRQLGRGILQLVDVYEGLHTLQTQYDGYCQKGYHKAPAPTNDDKDLDELEPTEAERTEKRQLQCGYTGILLMNKFINQFLQKVCKEGVQAMIKILKNGANSAKTHDTSTFRYLVGQELNRLVTEINKTRTKEFQAALEEHHLETESVIRAHQQALSVRVRVKIRPLLSCLLFSLLQLLHSNLSRSSHWRIDGTQSLQNDITGHLLCPVKFD